MSEERRVIPLHQNESYWLLDDETVAFYSAQDPRVFSTYPNYTDLKDKLAKYAGVAGNQILLTAGSDAAIRLLLEIYRDEGKRILLPTPTFYGYERILAQLRVPYEPLCHREESGRFVFPVDATIERIKSSAADVIFLCQPNNPLGSLIPEADMRAILDAADDSMTVVVDEAYFEFAHSSVLDRLSPRVVILRTLSKAFGLAGGRVGYVLADPTVVSALESRMLPWTIAHPSVHAAVSALDRVDFFTSRIAAVIDERERFSGALREIGVTVYPSSTNFVLARAQRTDEVSEYLAQCGILVARGAQMSSHPEARALLSDTLRIAVPSPSDSAAVTAAFRAALDKTL